MQIRLAKQTLESRTIHALLCICRVAARASAHKDLAARGLLRGEFAQRLGRGETITSARCQHTQKKNLLQSDSFNLNPRSRQLSFPFPSDLHGATACDQ